MPLYTHTKFQPNQFFFCGRLWPFLRGMTLFCKSRNIPYALQKGVRDELDRLERDGIISRVESSLWATPIVPVVKADGSIWVCGDFKTTVNPQLKPDDYPIPRVEDLFGSLAKGQRFSKIDLSQAYLHMEIAESDREILTLNTRKGLFRLNRLPFGIKTAPAIWQRAIVTDGRWCRHWATVGGDMATLCYRFSFSSNCPKSQLSCPLVCVSLFVLVQLKFCSSFRL